MTQKPKRKNLNKMTLMATMASMFGYEPPKPEYTKRQSKSELSDNYYKGNLGVSNPKVAAQMQGMHEKWEREQFPSRVHKKEPDPKSITSIKKQKRCHRHLARAIANGSIKGV